MVLIGIFSIPLMLNLCLEEAEGVNISAEKLLLKLLSLVLLPFIIGMTARKLTKLKNNAILTYVPSSCVILTVYTSSAAARKILYKSTLVEILLLTVAALAIHVILMLIALPLGKLIKLESPEMKALVFVTSQKTLPVAISVLTVLCDNPGAAIIPCLIFHFTQLFTDSGVASRLASKK